MGYHLTAPACESSRSLETAYPRSSGCESGFRFLHPGMGRWISKDPIGEKGGVNPYGFVLNRPSQLCDSIGLKVVVTLDPPDPTKITPQYESWADAPAIGGGTDYPKRKVTCGCVCDDRKKNKYHIACTISWTARIRINTGTTKKNEWTPRGIYGHEQKHVESSKDKVEKEVATPLRNKPGEFGEPICSRYAKSYEGPAQAGLDLWLKGGRYGVEYGWHEGEEGAPSGSPKGGTPYEPIRDSVDVPTTWEGL